MMLFAQDVPLNDKTIKDKLAAPPVFLDEQHQGPSLVPRNLPAQIFPFDCRAMQAYIHRVRPGEYHFQRAERLLGQGIDVIGCEAFGLDRFKGGSDAVSVADQAVKEAESAAALPIGLEQWRPGALRYLLISAYANAAKAHQAKANQYNSEPDRLIAQTFEDELRKVQALRDDGFSPAAQGSRTPLLRAVLSNDIDAAGKLLSAGTDVNATDSDHSSALRIAVVLGNAELVQLLLDHGANTDAPDEEGTTALMDACAIGSMQIASALIRAGARVNAKADDGSTPLLNAITRIALRQIWQSRREMVQALLDRHAEVNVADWQGVTPLIAAARTADTALISSLLSAGAEMEIADAQGHTPLLEAVDKNNVEAVKLLLAKQARLTVFDNRGRSPLILAANKGYPEGQQITKLLLDAGADPNLSNSAGWTPLMSAEAFTYKNPWGVSSHFITQELLKRGADPNARSKEGRTALIEAAGQYGPDDASFLQELIGAGASVNVSDDDGETALMAAAENGQLAKVRLLIDKGADVSARDKQGRTALQYARAPRNENDDEFPQCYDSLNGEDMKPNNDCEATRRLLKARLNTARKY